MTMLSVSSLADLLKQLRIELFVATTHSKVLDKKREGCFLDTSMSKIVKGTSVFPNDFCQCHGRGKNVPLPKMLCDIVDDVDEASNKE